MGVSSQRTLREPGVSSRWTETVSDAGDPRDRSVRTVENGEIPKLSSEVGLKSDSF